MIKGTLRSFLAEEPASGAPRRVWRDWVVVAAILIGSVIEAFTRDVPWPGPTLVVAAITAGATLARRTHRLPSLLVAFGATMTLSVLVAIFDGGVAGYYSIAWVLVIPYSVYRWGAGTEMAWAALAMIVVWAVSITTDPGTIGDAIGGLLVLVVASGAGWEVRQLSSRRARTIDRVRLAERELLARELHDTVAHHVSAIAIQAQAGQAVAASRPEAATDALAIIENEASRTLDEMRSMVSALRQDGSDADLAPQQGIGDIAKLASSRLSRVPVTVELVGDLDDLRPSVDTAVYRLAQESITNATRHAVGATAVDVSVHGDSDAIRLSVVDDGRSVAWTGEPHGFGLIGMKERAKLLGGAVSAGPAPTGGWRVDAVLPRNGARP